MKTTNIEIYGKKMEVDDLNNQWFKDPTTTVADGVETTIGLDPFAKVSSRSTLHRVYFQDALRSVERRLNTWCLGAAWSRGALVLPGRGTASLSLFLSPPY